ncbi:MAG: HPF/RaiA family ribosome-associated protein [Bdellovibrionales bacterium]|nr:HPF/RaiA family ribosome-associated protein [Bdellovibrionales bacterium]
MNIQVNTDHNIEGSAELNNYVTGTLSEAFERFNGAITRIEVHLSDENAGKTSANDKRCLLEARISHHTPIVVSHHADTIHQAIEGASDKLLHSLDKMVGKLTNHTSPKDLLNEEPATDTEDETTIY